MNAEHLRHLYARLAGDPCFVAGHIGVSDLAHFLEVDDETACRVGLCFLPRPGEIDVWLDRMSEHFRIDRGRLEHLLTNMERRRWKLTKS